MYQIYCLFSLRHMNCGLLTVTQQPVLISAAPVLGTPLIQNYVKKLNLDTASQTWVCVRFPEGFVKNADCWAPTLRVSDSVSLG